VTAPDCPRWDGCSSNLCPREDNGLRTFFPGEETCSFRDAPAWVKRARRISRVTGGDFDRGGFTVEMLSRRCVLTRAIKGLDPNAGPVTKARVEGWLKAHPETKKERPSAGLERYRRGKSSIANRGIRAGVVSGEGGVPDTLKMSTSEPPAKLGSETR
jgi:hypothetical protein